MPKRQAKRPIAGYGWNGRKLQHDKLIDASEQTVTSHCMRLNRETSLDFDFLYNNSYITQIITYRKLCDICIDAALQLHSLVKSHNNPRSNSHV